MLLGTIIAIILVGTVYGFNSITNIAAANISNSGELWIMQLASGTIPMFAAPVIFAIAVVKEPKEYLKAYKWLPITLIALTFGIMFSSMAIMEMLSNLNEKILSADFLKGFADWAREREDSVSKMLESLLQMDTIGEMLLNLLLIGLLTAIAEEFLFRGCLQTIFTRWTGNIHAAIWITAIIFSAFHMQFFGFLPRLGLGLLFGYLVAWSGNIWAGVWAHFINNGTAVVVTYLYQHKKINIRPDDQHVFNYKAYIVSVIFVLFLLMVFKRLAQGIKKIPAQ